LQTTDIPVRFAAPQAAIVGLGDKNSKKPARRFPEFRRDSLSPDIKDEHWTQSGRPSIVLYIYNGNRA
jgi:hypothetical protein